MVKNKGRNQTYEAILCCLEVFHLWLPEDNYFVMQMKSYVWLQTTDGSIQQVEEEVAMFCPVICREILQKSMGSSKLNAIVLPERVNPATLGLVLDYCRFHQVPGHSIKVLFCDITSLSALLWFVC